MRCNGCGTRGGVPSCTFQELIILQTGENSCRRSIEISRRQKKKGASVLIQIEKYSEGKKKINFFYLYLLLVRLITESTPRWVTPFQHMSKVFQSFVLAGCLDTWEIIGVVKFISLFTLNFFVIEQYSNDHLDFVKRNCCTGIRVAYGG